VFSGDNGPMHNGWTEAQLKRPSLGPVNWPGWFMVALLWVLGHLPRPVGRALLAPFGPLLRVTMSSRRRIAQRNIEACFPERSDAERERLLRQSFAALARMVVEMAWCWACRPKRWQTFADVRGLERLEALRAEGRSVLVVTAHVTCLEVGARVFGENVEGFGIYRPLGNPVLEWYQNRGRQRYAQGMISKRQLRKAIRLLKGGGMLWYAPDQDFGPAQSAFAPFFGVQTATLLATHRLPRLTGCAVMTMMPRYDKATGRYQVELSAPLDDFPGDDPAADLARVNALLEAQVRLAPEQYWWVHRRFKTRPEGEPDFYGRDARR